MKCPKCHIETPGSHVKNGFVKGKQRYLCKKCGFRYTTTIKRGVSFHLKRIALILYIEGVYHVTIANYLEVSIASVKKWIERYGVKKMDEIRGVSPRIEGTKYGIDSALGRYKYPYLLHIVWGIKLHDESVLYKKRQQISDSDITYTILPIHIKRVTLILYLLGYSHDEMESHLGSYKSKAIEWLKKSDLSLLSGEIIGSNKIIAGKKKNYLHESRHNSKSTHWLTLGWGDDSEKGVITKRSRAWEAHTY